jgi:aminoglycoside phosphotransferase
VEQRNKKTLVKEGAKKAIRSQLLDESEEALQEAKMDVETAVEATPLKLKVENLMGTHGDACQEK